MLAGSQPGTEPPKIIFSGYMVKGVTMLSVVAIHHHPEKKLFFCLNDG